jgi:hypothetical protein
VWGLGRRCSLVGEPLVVVDAVQRGRLLAGGALVAAAAGCRVAQGDVRVGGGVEEAALEHGLQRLVGCVLRAGLLVGGHLGGAPVAQEAKQRLEKL